MFAGKLFGDYYCRIIACEAKLARRPQERAVAVRLNAKPVTSRLSRWPVSTETSVYRLHCLTERAYVGSPIKMSCPDILLPIRGYADRPD